jgi:hypothetical protein
MAFDRWLAQRENEVLQISRDTPYPDDLRFAFSPIPRTLSPLHNRTDSNGLSIR